MGRSSLPELRIGVFINERALALAIPPHLSLAQEQPVQRDVLLEGQRDEKIRVGRRTAFIAMHVLLEHAQFPGELPLRSVSPNLGQALGKLLLVPFNYSSGQRNFSLSKSQSEVESSDR